MFKEIKPCCVFGFKRNEILITSCIDILVKCHDISMNQNEINSSMSDTKVPGENNILQRYLLKSSLAFLALPQK